MALIKQITNTYNKLSNWGKILLFIVLLLILVVFFKNFKIPSKEGFQQNDQLLVKTDSQIYDNFYVDIYDYLVHNDIKNSYEVGEIINSTNPTSKSVILDIGSGTGHHVDKLAEKGYNVTGIDQSEAMVKKSKENYPTREFMQGDITNSMQFEDNTFTHILCLYFTLYYIKDKKGFFHNCMNWLMPGGYLIIHVVDREMFDPILPPGNPLILVSPQRYAKERITSTRITFDDMDYSSNFVLEPEKDRATFHEKFKHKETGKVRKNQHNMYMESEDDILTMAQNVGFIIDSKIDLIKCHYEYQYLYVLVKPN